MFHHMRCAYGVRLIGVTLALVAGLVLSPALSVLPLGSAGAAMAEPACPEPPTSETPVTSGNGTQTACVAGAIRTVRGFIADCPTDSKALLPDAAYLKGECKGSITYQAEAVAQARFVAHENQTLAHARGEISPDVQWEVVIPPPASDQKGGRVDVMVFDSTKADSGIGLVELKVGKPGSAAQDHAAGQVSDYARDFPDKGDHEVDPLEFSEPYSDTFTIQQACNGQPSGPVRAYQAASTQAGVIMVTGVDASDAPPADQRLLEDEEPLSCPVLGVPDDLPSDAPAASPPIGTFCGYDPEELAKWLSDWAHYMITAPIEAAAAAQVKYGAVLDAAHAFLEGKQLADSAPEIKCPPKPPPAGGWGDPHLTTLDGSTFDMQTVGEFQLIQAPSLGMSIQARFVPWNGSTTVSTIDRVAFTLNGFDVEMGPNMQLLVDGNASELPEGEALYFNGGAEILRSEVQYVVIWPTSDTRVAVMEWSPPGQLRIRLQDGIQTSGMLGDHDGNPHNDYRLRDGTQLDSLTASKLDGEFADAWRVSDSDSLFSYGPDESTSSYTDPGFPSDVTTIADFPSDDIEVANQACHSAGVELGPQFDDCVFDVLVTGDDRYAADAAAVTGELVDPLAKDFDSQGSLSEDFTNPVPTNFAYTRYVDDPSTSRVAGPIFDSTPYAFYVLNVPRHDTVDLHLRLVSYGPVDTDDLQQTADLVVDDRAPVNMTLQGQSPSIDAPGTISFVRSGITAGGTSYNVYDVDVPLSHFGAALKVQLNPSNFRSLQSTSLGVNAVSLDLEVTPAQVFDVAMPTHVDPGAPTFGAGDIETAGGEDDFVFQQPDQRKSDLFIARNAANDIQVRLLNSAGEVMSPQESDAAHLRFNGLSQGQYTMQVTGTRGSTQYSLSANFIPPDLSLDYSIDDTAVTVDTAASGQNAFITFTGVKGQRVQLQTTEANYTDGGMQWSIQRPDGSIWQNSYWRFSANAFVDTTVLPADGTYRVLIDPGGTATGSVKFRAWTVPDDLTSSYVLDDPATTVTTTAPGQGAVVTFSGVKGQRVQLQTTEANYTDGGMQWSIQRPDGSIWQNSYWRFSANAFVDTTVLPQDGTYRVLIDPGGTATGSVKFRAWTVIDAPTDVTAEACTSSPTCVDVTWSPVAEATGYVVQVNGQAAWSGAGSSATIDGLHYGTQHITVLATRGAASSPPSAEQTVTLTEPTGSQYHPLGITRLVDTRNGTGSCTPSPCATVPAGGTLTMQVSGKGGVPTSGVKAVVLNVTALNSTASGLLVAYPAGESRPNGRSLSIISGTEQSNAVVTALSPDGKVTFYSGVNTDLLIDVNGWYSDPDDQTGSLFEPIDGTRVLDTRNGTGSCTPSPCARVAAAGTTTVQVGGLGGVPASGVTAVAFTLTAFDPSKSGYASVWPADQAQPSQRNLSYSTATDSSQLIVAKPSASGQLKLYTLGAADFTVDLAGYYTTSPDGTGSIFVPYDGNSGTQQRILDTRNGTGECSPAPCGAVGTSTPLTVTVAGHGDVPTGATAAVLSATAWTPTGDGGLVFWSADDPKPSGRNLSYAAGTTTTGTIQVPLSTQGQIKATALFHATDLTLDVQGWFEPAT